MTCQQAKTVRQGPGNDPLWPDVRIIARAGLQTAPYTENIRQQKRNPAPSDGQNHDVSIMIPVIRPDTIFKSP